jgi:hypothetical protein
MHRQNSVELLRLESQAFFSHRLAATEILHKILLRTRRNGQNLPAQLLQVGKTGRLPPKFQHVHGSVQAVIDVAPDLIVDVARRLDRFVVHIKSVHFSSLNAQTKSKYIHISNRFVRSLSGGKKQNKSDKNTLLFPIPIP